MLVRRSKNKNKKNVVKDESRKITEPVIIYRNTRLKKSKYTNFYKLVESFYPVIEETGKPNWEKLIHNYKYDIYHGTYSEYTAVWNRNGFALQAIYIELKGNRMHVSFDDHFINDLEELFPEEKIM